VYRLYLYKSRGAGFKADSHRLELLARTLIYSHRSYMYDYDDNDDVDDAKCVLVTRVCVSVPRRIPALLYGPGCNLGNGRDSPSCALLGGFAIGAWVSLL